MNRRQFIRNAGAGVIIFGGLSFIRPWEAWENEMVETDVLKPEKIEGFNQDEVIILQTATRAPSGHNAQPWTVRRIKPYHWAVGIAEDRLLPAIDPQNRETFLSIGAFIESLVLAAGAYGYKVAVNIVAKERNAREVAEVNLIRGVRTDFPLEKLIMRRTIRNGHENRELLAEDIKHLVKGEEGSISFFSPQSASGKFLAEGTIAANMLQVYRKSAQQELADWIRWSNADVRRHMNGLTPDTMDINGIAGWYVRRFYNRQSVLEKSFREETVKRVTAQVCSCGGWLIINSPTASIKDLIASGRILQTMWLRAKEKMIAIHPMTQMLEEPPYNADLGKELGIPREVQFILRTGYVAKYPAPVSPRMPVSKIIGELTMAD